MNNQNENYIFYTNEENEKVIKKIDLEKDREINIIFDTAEVTDAMKEVVEELTKFYAEDILEIQN